MSTTLMLLFNNILHSNEKNKAEKMHKRLNKLEISTIRCYTKALYESQKIVTKAK